MQGAASQMTADATGVAPVEFLERLEGMGYELRRSAVSTAVRPQDFVTAAADAPANVYLLAKDD